MKIAFAALSVAMVCLAGCATTTKEWVATGGSRSDGVVKLSYQYGLFELPQVSEEQALTLAKRHCAAWGYTGAEPFGGQTVVCINPIPTGCRSWQVTREYQCTGNPEK
jgi:hypothetical protein